MNSVKNEISDKAGKQLTGITVLVTRPKDQAYEFMALLESAGATVIEFPAIRITDPISWDACDAALAILDDFGVIVFTSSNAVRYFMKRLTEAKMKILQSKRIFAVGAKTKESLNLFNLNAEVITSEYMGRALGMEMMKITGKDEKILFPHGNKGKFEILEVLKAAGYDVTDVVVYQNTGPGENDIEQFRTVLKEKTIDVYSFFSPSSVKNLLDILPAPIPDNAVVAVIGPTTAQAARESELSVHIQPRMSTSEDLADAIIDYFGRAGKNKIE